MPSLDDIYAFRRIAPNLGTSGQPSEEQFVAIRDAGFQVVINLALPTSDNAIPHEASLVTKLGMSYVHIPVHFQSPAAADFQAFTGVMRAFADRPKFVHCAANMRVSAFVFLHRVLFGGVDISDARRDLTAIWEPDAVWSQFIDDQLAGKAAKSA